MIEDHDKPRAFESKVPMDQSIIAQLIMCGLVARYGRDPDGMKRANEALIDELRQRGWTLSPYTDD